MIWIRSFAMGVVPEEDYICWGKEREETSSFKMNARYGAAVNVSWSVSVNDYEFMTVRWRSIVTFCLVRLT